MIHLGTQRWGYLNGKSPLLSTCRASGPRSLQLLEEGRQGPLADSPLGPGWGLWLGLCLFPRGVLGLKPHTSL